MVISADGQFNPLAGIDGINLSQVLRDAYYLFPSPEQQRHAASKQSVGRRATSGHASDFSMDRSPGHVNPPCPSAPPHSELFDLNEYPQQEEGFVGHDLQHEYDYGGASAPGMSGFGLYNPGSASMPDVGASDVGSSLDAGMSQGHPYKLRTQTAPPDKCTLSQYSKKTPRK
ncbi:uncharacterized protein DS421_5g149310 [Arachis hypogaea]|nr:uncharacterized protein DS421_5g149310 [Arachis hypogaea]